MNDILRHPWKTIFRGKLKLVSEEGSHFWVVPDAGDNKKAGGKIFFLRMEGFFDGSSPRRVALDNAPIFMASGLQHGLLAMTKGYENMEWIAVKLDKALTKVEKYGDLKSMLLVGTTTMIGDKYYVGGMSKKNRPVLTKMSADLRIESERIVESKTEGRMGSIFTAAGKTYVTMGFMDGSEIWEISPDLTPLKKIKLAGAAATGVPLRDGGFAVTYTTLPDLSVFVEKFDSSARSLWKKKIYTLAMTGAGTAPILCELQDSLGLVAGNDNHLLVARIDSNGQRMRITVDKQSGLAVPLASAGSGYLVGVLDNKIHVRGMARNPDAGATVTSFHFVETTTP